MVVKGRTALRGAVVGASLIASMIPAALPASGAVLERDRYHDFFTDQFEACGTTVRIDVEATGTFMLRTRGTATPVYVHDRFLATETYTDLATGESFTRTLRLNHTDVRIELIEGTRYLFTWQDAGTVVVRTGDGELGYRDAGLVRVTVPVDTMGNADLDDDEHFWDEVQVELRGKLPPRDFCEDLAAFAT